MVNPRMSVICPTCKSDTYVSQYKLEDGYDLEPFWDVIDGVSVLVTERIPARVVGWLLRCGCIVERPPWVLRIEGPGIRPIFIKEE